MKKNAPINYITITLIALISVTGCKKDNPVSCTDKLAKVTAAQLAYVRDDNTENCKSYKVALQDYMSSCSSGISADQKAQFEATIASMNCP